MNRFKKKKQQQLEAEAQTKALAPSNPDHEDYLSGDFDGQPPTTSTTTSKRAAELPPEAMSKKAKAANAAEKLQEGMNTPLPQVPFTLQRLPVILPTPPPFISSCLVPFASPYPHRTMSAYGCSS